MTNIIYLIGLPGTGKYTIAKEIAKLENYKICDNQLVNNPIFELLGYNGFQKVPECAWKAIRKIRTNIFDFLSLEPQNNYVLTNCLAENEYDHSIFDQVEEMASKRESVFMPVKLLISQEENAKRIQNPARRQRFKSIDPETAYSNSSEGLINIDHPNLLELDVTNVSALEAAEKILEQKLLKSNN